MLFKFLLIVSIILYLVYKIGGFFFRAGAASQQFRTPPPQPKPSKRSSQIKGGDYVDYEEVK